MSLWAVGLLLMSHIRHCNLNDMHGIRGWERETGEGLRGRGLCMLYFV